jgi:hypothetical protein
VDLAQVYGVGNKAGEAVRLVFILLLLCLVIGALEKIIKQLETIIKIMQVAS